MAAGTLIARSEAWHVASTACDGVSAERPGWADAGPAVSSTTATAAVTARKIQGDLSVLAAMVAVCFPTCEWGVL
jgi:hypothetical protein